MTLAIVTSIASASIVTQAQSFSLGDAFFDSQNVGLNQSVNGTYDLSVVSGLAGLSVTITGNATRTTANNGTTIFGGESINYLFNTEVDGLFAFGQGLSSRERNQLVTNGTITGAPSASRGITLNQVTNNNQTSIISYSNLSNTGGNVVQSPFAFESLNGTIFNASVTSLNGSDPVLATFTNRFTVIPPSNVPEPTSTALLGLGVALFIIRRKR